MGSSTGAGAAGSSGNGAAAASADRGTTRPLAILEKGTRGPQARRLAGLVGKICDRRATACIINPRTRFVLMWNCDINKKLSRIVEIELIST